MIDEDVTQSTGFKTLVKWLILGVFILGFRFLRWGGMMGLVGIGTFAGTIWLAFRLADPETGALTGADGTVILALLIVGVLLYVIGVRRRRRRMRRDALSGATRTG
jgi:hypothetical protein